MTQQTEKTTAPAAVATDDEFSKLLDRGYRPDGAFQQPAQFAFAQRIGKMLVKSEMVPPHFRGTGEDKLANAVIAIDIAMRLKMSPLLVMKQIYMVYGQPGFTAQLAIAAINCSGKFSRIRFRVDGEGDDWGCIAYATDLASGDVLEGGRVSIATAKKEGWYEKKDSKWKSIPDQMLRYRAAAWWGRLYAPELLMGLSTVDELEDKGPPEIKIEKPLFKSPSTEPPPVTEAITNPEEVAASILLDKVNHTESTEAHLMHVLRDIGLASDSSKSLAELQPEVIQTIFDNFESLMQKAKEVKL